MPKGVTSYGIEFTSGDPRLNRRNHRVTGIGNDAPGSHETF
jgi:hypothetical protein